MIAREMVRGWVAGLAVVLLLAGVAEADGFIVIEQPPAPPGPPPVGRPPRIRPAWAAYMPLEVKNHKVVTDIRETVAVTKIDQVFHNPNPVQLDGTYLFPLPENASVHRFSMWMDGKEVHGEILDAEKARTIYEDIVRKMRDPALLEYVGGRVYRARVFPIPPNGDVRVALEYGETIDVNDGLAAYRYPLNTEKFSAKDIEDVSIAVTIRGQAPLKSVFCPSHNATISRPSDREARVGFEAHHVRPDRDFLVYYQIGEKEFGTSLLTHRLGGEDGYFLLRIAPPAIGDAGKVLPKDVCFVFDTSGSMAGEKIAQAKRALRHCLSSLREEDRFNIISFATEVRPFREGLVPASRENVNAARAEVDKLVAAGGTNINQALQAALKAGAAATAERPYMVVFMTDGEPTIDERDPEKIQANVRKANEGRCRLFVFGVGHDLNTKLLDRLAEDNRGAREYIDEREDIEVKVSSFFRKVGSPVLSDVELVLGGASVVDVYPKQMPDLFAGGELTVVGRYRTPGRHVITLHGRRAGERLTWQYPATFAEKEAEADFLPRLWATRKVGYLMDEIRLRGETQELKDEIIRLAKRYAIVTPYTSYLVLEDGERRGLARAETGGPAAAQRVFVRVRQAAGQQVPNAAGWTREAKGQTGVEGSRHILALRDASPAEVQLGPRIVLDSTAGDPGDATGTVPVDSTRAEAPVQIVGAKTFYRADDRWVDADYDGKAKTQKVKAFSDEYFKLLRDVPDMGKYLAVGPRVIVVVAKTAYESVERTPAKHWATPEEAKTRDRENPAQVLAGTRTGARLARLLRWNTLPGPGLGQRSPRPSRAARPARCGVRRPCRRFS